MRLAVSAFLVGLALTLSPVKASTVSVSSIDTSMTVTSTKKKASAKALQSPLSFTATNPLTVGQTSPFVLGTLNVAKFKKKSVDLNLAINGTAGGTPFVLNLIYRFTVGAVSGCNAGKACKNAVSISTILANPVTVQSGNSFYTVAADGFVEVLGEATRSFILQPKNGAGTRTPLLLQGSFTVSQQPPSAVPVPAAGLMLLGALGAIGMIRRRTV